MLTTINDNAARARNQRVVRAADRAAFEMLEGRQLLAAPTPFPVETPSLPDETVLFANYDVGGQGVSYYDVDRRNQGGEYRRKDRVDLERVSDAPATNIGDAPGIGRGVGHVRAGEWLTYNIDVTTAGTYRFELRYATGSQGGTAHVEVDGNDVTGPLDLASTAGWQKWRTLQESGVELDAGRHTLKFVIDSGNGDVANLHWFRFAAEGSEAPVGNPGSVKTKIDWPDGWKQLNDAPSPRFEAMTHAFDGNLFVFGGFKNSDFDVDRSYAIYNPEKNRWKTLGTLPDGMAETHAMPVDDGRFIYFAGGFAGDLKHGEDPTQEGSNRVWRYEPDSNRWLELPSLPVVLGGGGAAIVKGQLHVFGGNHEDRFQAVGDHYVMKLSNTSAGWEQARSHPDPKDHFSTVALNGKIYTVGGEYGHDIDFNTQQSVHVYNPKKDRWKRLADLPIPSGHAEGSTFAYKGQIIFAGGQTKDQAASDRVFAYNPADDEWNQIGTLPGPLQGSSVSVFGNKVLVTLGGRYTVQPLATTYVGTI